MFKTFFYKLWGAERGKADLCMVEWGVLKQINNVMRSRADDNFNGFMWIFPTIIPSHTTLLTTL